MRLVIYLAITLFIISPINVFAGLASGFQTDQAEDLISAYYDLRDRSSYIQVTNTSSSQCTIHVQIFQHDRNCDELDFFDLLTPSDTVIYDMDNIIKNDGNAAPINLQDDSLGYVVVSGECDLIGNFRIIDNANYEYRTNMQGDNASIDKAWANFNTVDGAILADVVGFNYIRIEDFTVINDDRGFEFDIFVYDLAEDPLSCDVRNFACGKIINYGINEDYPNSRDGELLCPGGGLTDPPGGFISLENGRFPPLPPGSPMLPKGRKIVNGYIGINNGNGTGSMDSWNIMDD